MPSSLDGPIRWTHQFPGTFGYGGSFGGGIILIHQQQDLEDTTFFDIGLLYFIVFFGKKISFSTISDVPDAFCTDFRLNEIFHIANSGSCVIRC